MKCVTTKEMCTDDHISSESSTHAANTVSQGTFWAVSEAT